MIKSSPTYRLAALVLSFTLGAALPALCQQGGGAMLAHSDAAGHPTAPCEGACHAGEQPATMPLAAAVVQPSERSPAGPAVLPALVVARVAPAGAPLAEERSTPRVARAGPVRRHVYNAVFLN